MHDNYYKAGQMVVSFAGSVCAGKTTIARRLAHEQQITVIPEYMSLLVGEQRVLFDRIGPEGRLACLLKIDSQRNTLIHSSATRIVLDRSVLCLFAFEYAMKAINTNYSNSYLRECLDSTHYLIPDKIIFFEVAEVVRRARCKDRGGMMAEFLLQSDFNRYLKEFFEMMSKVVCTRFIDSSRDGFENIYELVRGETLSEFNILDSKDVYYSLRSIFAQW